MKVHNKVKKVVQDIILKQKKKINQRKRCCFIQTFKVFEISLMKIINKTNNAYKSISEVVTIEFEKY